MADGMRGPAIRAAQLEVVADFSTQFWGRNDALAWSSAEGRAMPTSVTNGRSARAIDAPTSGTSCRPGRQTAFREGVDLDRAVDILWGLNTDEVFHLFVRERGWAPDDYKAWLLALLRHEILAAD